MSISSQSINWYPGHMFKTKRELKESLNMVDVSIEVLDARIPMSSRNYDLINLVDKKTRIKKIIVLNKADLANPVETEKWIKYLTNENTQVVKLDSSKGKGIKELKEVIRSYKKGISTVRTLIMGIPNVGKSTLINSLNGKKSLTAQNRPGVTKSLKWLRIDSDISMLDTPGMLWPKFEDEDTGNMLAITGSIKDEILDTLEVTYQFIKKLHNNDDNSKDFKIFLDKYDIESERWEELKDEMNPYYSLILEVAVNKKMLRQGGVPDEARVAKAILTDFRNGKTGQITLEKVEDYE